MIEEIFSFLLGLFQGIAAFLLGLLRLAVILLIAAIVIWPFRANYIELRTAGQWAQAERIYKEAGASVAFEFLDGSVAQRDQRIKFKLASFAAEAGMEAEAQKTYIEIIYAQPHDPRGYYYFAEFWEGQGELEKATERMEEAIRRASSPRKIVNKPSDSIEFWIALAMDLMPDPLIAKALELPPLPRVAAMQVKHVWWQHLRSSPNYLGAPEYQIVESTTDLDEVIRVLEEDAKEKVNDPDILAALGWAKYHKGWFREAGVDLEKSLRSEQYQASHDYVRTLAYYGAVRWEEGDEGAAIAVWREGWCEDNEHEELQRIMRYYYKGKFEEADSRHRQSLRGAVLCRISDR